MKTTSTAALAGAFLSIASASCEAADFKAGDWDLSVGGIINAFYTRTHCSGSQDIGGLALATQALGCGGKDGRTVIGNGLLPNALVTSGKSKQEGYDVGATLMIGAATASDDAIGNNSNVDVRQAFLTIGDADIGTFKLGRDYGLFGQAAILGDMTLFGAGAPVSATQRNRVTLGHIGAGYTYLGTYGQIAWASPSYSGFTARLALVSPVDASGTTYTGKTSPQLQAAAGLDLGPGKVWAGAKSQKFDAPPESAGFTMNGFEVGGSVVAGGFGLLVNLQSGKGLGVLSDGDTGPRKQTNVLVQGTFQATPKLKLGVNWGESRLRDGAGTDLRSNANLTGGLYFGITKSVTLTGELSHTASKSVAGDTAKLDGAAVGAILFF